MRTSLLDLACPALEARTRRAPFAALALSALACSAAHAGPLNDSGLLVCRNHATGADTAITATTSCQPLDTHGAQDARYGRDAAAAKGALYKEGGSGAANGFDYTKISNSGAELPESAALGSGPNDWACTRDNNTGLIWEVKVNDATHLRHVLHSYTWFNSANTYGGKGVASGGTCKTTGRCDTEKFTQDVNAAGLCGKTDWRMPTRSELYNLADRGRPGPSIDRKYFSPSVNDFYWSANLVAGQPGNAWLVYFHYGDTGSYSRSETSRVRLVRSGP